MSVAASPSYLKRCGIPDSPQALTEHDGIYFAFNGVSTLALWSFEGNEGFYIVMLRPRIIVNDIAAMLKYAEAGLGVVYIYIREIESLVSSEKLTPILSDLPSSQAIA